MRAVASRVTTGEQGEPLKLAAVDTLSVLPHNLETKNTKSNPTPF